MWRHHRRSPPGAPAIMGAVAPPGEETDKVPPDKDKDIAPPGE